MKYFITIVLVLGCIINALAQVVTDSVLPGRDSIVNQPVRKPDTSTAKHQPVRKPDTSKAKTGLSASARARLDSITKARHESSAQVRHDSSAKRTVMPSKKVIARPVSLVDGDLPVALRNHPYYNFFGSPRYELKSRRDDAGKEGLFYLLTGVILYFALVRLVFRKYINNLFSVFFRVSLKQKQIREQLLQSPLPSLLLNIFFIISGGIYISFLLRYYDFVGTTNLWILIVNSTIALGLVYLVKFFMLKTMGWIFNIAEATDTYVFIVFLVNKLMGILLVPFLVLLAFSDSTIITVLVTLSFAVIIILFAYRYIISYAPVRKEIKVSQFHFFLYLCALEIMPLLLIYKVLLTFLERSS